jgi:hypothetical protein
MLFESVYFVHPASYPTMTAVPLRGLVQPPARFDSFGVISTNQRLERSTRVAREGASDQKANCQEKDAVDVPFDQTAGLVPYDSPERQQNEYAANHELK